MIQQKHETALFEYVGRKIRRLRRERGHTQEDLAKLVQLSRTSVTNIERGRQRPPLQQLLHMAYALDCELHDLLPRRSDLGVDADLQPAIDIQVIGDMTPEVEQLLSRLKETR